MTKISPADFKKALRKLNARKAVYGNRRKASKKDLFHNYEIVKFIKAIIEMSVDQIDESVNSEQALEVYLEDFVFNIAYLFVNETEVTIVNKPEFGITLAKD